MAKPTSANEFHALLEECRKMAAKDLDSLSLSLSKLRDNLENIQQELFQDNSPRKPIHKHNDDQMLDYAMSLLQLNIVRIGSCSERRIQDQIDACLDICGCRSSFMAAMKIIKGNSDSSGDIILVENEARVENSIASSPSSIIASIHTTRRLLLTTTIEEYQSELQLPKGSLLLKEFVAAWKQSAPSSIQNEKVSIDNATKSFVNLVTLLPNQVVNACHKCKLALPSWVTKPKYYARLVECATFMAHYCKKSMSADVDIDVVSISEIYLENLVQKLVHLGMQDCLSSGMHRFWRKAVTLDITEEDQSNAIVVDILKNACLAIKSPRQSALLLCSIIKYLISEVEIYSDEMTAEEFGKVCRNECMPFLNQISLPILNESSMLQDAFVQLVILSPSQTTNAGEQKLLARCVVELLASCLEGAEESDGSDSDIDADADEGDVLMKHLADVAMVWSESSFVNNIDNSRQRHVSYFIIYAIGFMEKNSTRSLQQMAVQELIPGVSNRLKVSEESCRIDGMRVAEQLAPILGQTLNFEELDGVRDENTSKNTTDLTDETNKGVECPNKKDERLSRSRKRENRSKTPKELDPDEDYNSDSSSCSNNSSVGGDSAYSSDSEWDEEGLLSLEIRDDEEDLRVVPRPKYLRECLDLLRADGDDHVTVCKHEAALKELPCLVRNLPPDLADFASSLARELLYKENKFDLPNFVELRLAALCALAACEFAAVEFLEGQLFVADAHLGTRMDILQVIKNTANELSGQLELDKIRSNQTSNALLPKVAGKRSLVSDELIQKSVRNITAPSDGTMKESNTRRWGRGRRIIENKTVKNMFGQLAPNFFYPLLKGFSDSKGNEVLWGDESGGMLLSNLLITLSVIVDNSGLHPGTAVLAQDLFELSWSFFVAENGEVRRAVLVALATCLPCLPSDYILRNVVGHEQFTAVLRNTATFDSNEHCRLLASSIVGGLSQLIAM